MQEGRPNAVGARTSVRKLNGVVYTPLPLARAVVARLELTDGQVWVDPSCGEGVFLEAMLERMATLGVALRLEGWDLDADALVAAEHRLAAAAERLGLRRCWTLVHRNGLEGDDAALDGIVGNPPYLEAKRMAEAQKAQVRTLCPVSARGGFDLYAAFVERSVGRLTPGGTLAFVVPNRIAVTASTGALRSWLLAQGEVELVDLSDGLPFPDAAVYPVVLIVRRGRSPRLVTGPSAAPGAAVFERAWVEGAGGGVWPLPSTAQVATLLSGVVERVGASLGDRFDVRWTVSFHASGLRDRYVFAERPDSPHARRFVGGGRYAGNREVAPYRLAWAGAWIDHDEARARADGNALPAVTLFDGPKVVICQNARRCRAALDRDGFVLKDTFLMALPREGVGDQDLAWLVIVLHSALFHLVYEALHGGTRKGGGFIHFLGGYLSRFPWAPPPPDLDACALLADLEAGRARTEDVEAWVATAYGLTAAERDLVAALPVPKF